MKTVKYKILIFVPGEEARGGITNYYQSIKKHFSPEICYFTRGSRTWPMRKGNFHELLRLLNDYWMFFCLMRRERYQLVQTTSDFDILSLIRDCVFIFISKLHGAKVITFFRGWNPKYHNEIPSSYLLFLRYTFFKADAIIDLSKENRSRLKSWGYCNEIYLETTLIDVDLLKGIDEQQIITKIKHKIVDASYNILYLGRVEIDKGVYEIIDTYALLKSSYINISLTIAGDGYELEEIKRYTINRKLADVSFLGFIYGNRKKLAFDKADVFLFPSHHEGMPNSVLEAMAFGLPVITRNVGGLPDFFFNDVNGYITDSHDPNDFYKLICIILNNEELFISMALNNHRYALTHFTSDIVAHRIETIFNEVILKSSKTDNTTNSWLS